VLLDTWRRHPQWPRLTVVQHPKVAQPGAPAANIVHRVDYLDDASLRRLQNAHRFHICPSEAEGFGHYLMEAMSVGAVVLATDAAPMNELVTPPRGLLIPVADMRRNGLVARACVDQAGVEHAVDRALALSDEARAALGARARAFFVANDREFRQRLPAACAS
jgi:glycosyltransferase involved in cell wall biosynthesis